jgi:hypothetical protein
MYPTPRQITVALGALNSEAALWMQQSERLVEITNMVAALRITGAGTTIVFDAFLDAYDEVVQSFALRCSEGRGSTESVASTLSAVGTTYAEEEAANLHAQMGLY